MTSSRTGGTPVGANHEKRLAVGRDVELVKVGRIVLGQVQQLRPLAQHQAGVILTDTDQIIARSIEKFAAIARPHRPVAALDRDCHPIALPDIGIA